jgi:hypothetical protein
MVDPSGRDGDPETYRNYRDEDLAVPKDDSSAGVPTYAGPARHGED